MPRKYNRKQPLERIYNPICKFCNEREKIKKLGRCKECHAEWRKAYYDKNQDKIIAYHRKWDNENVDHKAKYAANPQAAVRRVMKHREKNPLIGSLTQMNHRAKQYGHTETVTYAEVLEIAAKYPTCIDCGSDKDLTFGHLFPLIYPTSCNRPENIVRQCKSCNSKQRTRVHYLVADSVIAQLYPVYIPKELK